MKIYLRQFCYLMIVCFLLSCNTENEKVKKSSNDLAKNKVDSSMNTIKAAMETISKCLPKYLQIDSNNFSINYIDKSNYYTIELRIDSVTKVLDYEFNCNAPVAIVPRYKLHYHDYLCLERGCSDRCVEYSLYKREGKKIIEVGRYYKALTIDLKRGICVNINDQTGELVISNFIKKVIKSKKIHYRNSGVQIEKAVIQSQSIKIVFEDNSTEIFDFK